MNFDRDNERRQSEQTHDARERRELGERCGPAPASANAAHPTPEEIAAAEDLFAPMVKHGTEYERAPTVLEVALRLRALRAEWLLAHERIV